MESDTKRMRSDRPYVLIGLKTGRALSRAAALIEAAGELSAATPQRSTAE